MGAIDDDGLWGLWGCEVPKGVEARDALLKRLLGKRVKRVDRKPFYSTNEVQAFSGDAEWDWRENVALTENMTIGFLEHSCIV